MAYLLSSSYLENADLLSLVSEYNATLPYAPYAKAVCKHQVT